MSKKIFIATMVAFICSCSTGVEKGPSLVSGSLQTQDLDTYSDMTPETVRLSREEQKLVELVMQHRKDYGLPQIPVSRSLTYVAKMHLLDVAENNPVNGKCNGHSWSDQGEWSPCCYTDDHAQAQCMWEKPRELTPYQGSGFEISFGASGGVYSGFSASAEVALEGWKSSQLHHDVILNRKKWTNSDWKAIGVAIYKSSAVIWFGEYHDPL